MPLQDDVLCASAIVAAMIGMGVLAKMTQSDRASAPQMTRAAKELMRQSLSWLDMCSSHQDAAYKLQTATLATAYCNAARTLASDDELARALNIDVHEQLRGMESMQRKTLVRLQKGRAAAAGKDGAAAPKAEGTAIGSSVNWL